MPMIYWQCSAQKGKRYCENISMCNNFLLKQSTCIQAIEYTVTGDAIVIIITMIMITIYSIHVHVCARSLVQCTVHVLVHVHCLVITILYSYDVSLLG